MEILKKYFLSEMNMIKNFKDIRLMFVIIGNGIQSLN